ncbi:hypothetical protein ILUMI_12597 [Ignelater luminosus]|uniref:Exonuclease domain-containing protein n=1 Tax=Ignelater luminosus TaxID=2038154 RepID=A0A8K0CZ96_IGNLU|nr:hypothetical protein ILUMI_12597 [Ignelater luminosus]
MGFRKLGLVKTITVDIRSLRRCGVQTFDFLFVLDFESTCWAAFDVNKGLPEIIEFSVVLYDISDDKIIEEFQQYVMPVENPKLSEFCKDFTGITQQQVENAVPLGTCLMVFGKWVNEQKKKYNLNFLHISKEPAKKQVVFATWSNWDLNTCLNSECKRKRLNKSEIFNAWIDLKFLYKEHYHRKPVGLKGALTEVGLNFNGREHSGLHDARNTAALAGKMIIDGVLLQITKDISCNH